MKKSIFLLTMAVAVMTGCLKDESVNLEQAQEITLTAVAKTATKADSDIHEGTVLMEEYSIYASATERRLDGTIENESYFTDIRFDTNGNNEEYHAFGTDGNVAPIYWPLGGCALDYLAYAMPKEKHDNKIIEAAWENEGTDVASLVSFKGWDTYTNQVDLLYAAKNGATADKNPIVNLTFSHAQALLQFNVKVNEDKVMKITEIKIDGLLVKGDFIVDNTKNKLNAYWNKLSKVEKEDIVKDGGTLDNDCIGEPLSKIDAFKQVGSTLLIPPQPALNFTVTYEINGKPMTYEYNHTRKAWEMGKQYVYNLDFNLNEIVITPDVKEYENDMTNEKIS